MGMFDAFHLRLGDHEVEIQTKRFDCILERYSVGDPVSGAPAGLHIYFDRVRLDENGRPVYRADAEHAEDWTLFLVLAHGILVDAEADPRKLTDTEIKARIDALTRTFSDSARVIECLARAIRHKHEAIARLEAVVGAVRHVLSDTRRLRAGETLSSPFELIHESSKRLARGDDPIDVIEGVLNEDHRFLRADPNAVPDTLEPYRL